MRDMIVFYCARHSGHTVKQIISPIATVREAFKMLLSSVVINDILIPL